MSVEESYPAQVVGADGATFTGEQYPKENCDYPCPNSCGKLSKECACNPCCRKPMCARSKECTGDLCSCPAERVCVCEKMKTNPMIEDADLHFKIKEVVQVFDPKEVDWKNPIPTALKIGQHVETIKDLVGKDKFKVVKGTMKILVTKSEISQEEKQSAHRFLDDVLPAVMQAAVSVSKGEFSLKKEADDLKEAAQEIFANPLKVGEVVKRELEERKVALAACTSCWGMMKDVAQKK